jgi:transposase-like protein
MAGFTAYSMMLKGSSKEHSFSVRKRIVQEAQAKGIKPTARRHGISRNTLRTWLRRFHAQGNNGLKDRRQGPHHIPHKLSAEEEAKVIKARNQAPCYGPKRLRFYFELNCSSGAIQRILKDHQMTRKHKKKYQTKNDLRAEKAKYLSFSHLQMDLKHLYDIPNYWGQMKSLGLPRYQYTVRDTKSGALFLGFSDELSQLNACTMVHYVLERLKIGYPEGIVIQTDNGVEFSGTTRHFEKAVFSQVVTAHGASHRFIPPGMCNANGDVESSHNIIEKEFYDLVKFTSRQDFMEKVESYRLFFNFGRMNYSKGVRSPYLIVEKDLQKSNFAGKLKHISTIDLDRCSIKWYTDSVGGQPIPVLPGKGTFLGTFWHIFLGFYIFFIP